MTAGIVPTVTLRTSRHERTNSDQLHGTLDMLVLKALEPQRMHGYAIAVRLAQLSNEILRVEEGSLYPALYRMEERGWLASEWAISETGRRARFYRLTSQGRAQLRAETASWARLTAGVASVLSS
jgi:PadR family transcriptional regulator PadR